MRATRLRATRREGIFGSTSPAVLPASKLDSKRSTALLRWLAIHRCAGCSASRTETAVAV